MNGCLNDRLNEYINAYLNGWIYGGGKMSLEKKQIRKSIMQLRDKISTEEKQRYDKAIFQNIIDNEYYKAASTIFIFVSYLSEVDTKSVIIQAIADNKTICVPKVKSKEEGIELFKINGLNDLEEGFHGILEPKSNCEKLHGVSVSVSDDEGNDVDDANNEGNIDLIIMPGVAFDMTGGRIGYGGGFYDKFISKLKKDVKKIAIAYELQIIENIPMKNHDVRIDGIITEKQTTIFNIRIEE
jgi:5-formyltetrahydrofolate cyclo-ligase